MKKFIANTTIAAMLFSFAAVATSAPAHAAVPNWNLTGNYVVAFTYLGIDYPADLSLTQDGSGDLTGNGGSPIGGTYTNTWVLTSGTVSGDAVTFQANYTAPPSAVTPLTTITATGTVASDGTISGTWSDNYQGTTRTGTWRTTTGIAATTTSATATSTATWDVTGDYIVAFNLDGDDFLHSMSLTQGTSSELTGSGGHPATGTPQYTWTITSGSVVENMITFNANYTAPADAVTPLTVMHATGTIATDGTMSGTWTDNYQGTTRSGTWSTTSGAANMLVQLGGLAPLNLSVTDENTINGRLRGYLARFNVIDATLGDIESLNVKLYASSTLLQTNTATAQFLNSTSSATTTELNSPFDVSGSFNYASNGNWTNTRASEYGQTQAATKAVATAVMENGKVVTAEITNLLGNPSTIFPTTTPPVATTTPPVATTTPPVLLGPTDKDQCKNGGWRNFQNPSFKNQGQCVSYTNHNNIHRAVDEYCHDGINGWRNDDL